jgi:hypothetical protein
MEGKKLTPDAVPTVVHRERRPGKSILRTLARPADAKQL